MPTPASSPRWKRNGGQARCSLNARKLLSACWRSPPAATPAWRDVWPIFSWLGPWNVDDANRDFGRKTRAMRAMPQRSWWPSPASHAEGRLLLAQAADQESDSASVLGLAGIWVQELIHDVLRVAKRCLLETVEGCRQIDDPVLAGEAQDAKRTCHLYSLTTRGFYAAPIIHQQ